jgi:hypothetical protein
VRGNDSKSGHGAKGVEAAEPDALSVRGREPPLAKSGEHERKGDGDADDDARGQHFVRRRRLVSLTAT